MLDTLIRGGWVIDGTGSPAYPADIAIQGERIVDVNGHSDWTFFSNPTQEGTVRQGVTTEVVGNCGNGFAPVSSLSRDFIAARCRTLRLAAGVSGPLGLASGLEFEPMGRHTRSQVATNTVYMDQLRPSHLVLPVVPAQ